eukprot:gnl/MRDRNA2_/MRDRNA2_46509_c0_seq1.p1 gnl/MRDRNA2_/MRDRNA2_46509_c0~~gnl/MRDRNA2_/MRDRNA2_46509_c0_seq1.p1  ORF type:complete len:528 (-),score=101.08 gnl/MRDRNA2_/MRDRNA2_46509_c0_seq1:18-1601(-)
MPRVLRKASTGSASRKWSGLTVVPLLFLSPALFGIIVLGFDRSMDCAMVFVGVGDRVNRSAQEHRCFNTESVSGPTETKRNRLLESSQKANQGSQRGSLIPPEQGQRIGSPNAAKVPAPLDDAKQSSFEQQQQQTEQELVQEILNEEAVEDDEQVQPPLPAEPESESKEQSVPDVPPPTKVDSSKAKEKQGDGKSKSQSDGKSKKKGSTASTSPAPLTPEQIAAREKEETERVLFRERVVKPLIPQKGMHFWTYGSGKWKGAVERIKGEANRTGLFEGGVWAYRSVPAEIKKNAMWSRHVNSARGAGYWFWKAAITQTLLNEKVKDGQWLIYADAGCSLGGRITNLEAWVPLLNLTKTYDIIAFRVDQVENKWTKGDIFAEFGVKVDSKGYGLAKQVCATTFLIARNSKTRKFVDLWVSLVANYHLISDEPSRQQNSGTFTDNRHDQSLWSMMIKANQPVWPDSKRPQEDYFWGKNDPGFEPQSRHNKYGIPDLKIRVLRDMTWPPKFYRTQAISATRKATALKPPG